MDTTTVPNRNILPGVVGELRKVAGRLDSKAAKRSGEATLLKVVPAETLAFLYEHARCEECCIASDCRYYLVWRTAT